MSHGPGIVDASHEDWLDALARDEGYYLNCSEGHGSLPPRRVCPHCGASELTRESLPATGEIETYTVVHVAPPDFVDDAPYVTAVVDFGPVRLTGVVRGIDHEAIGTGTAVRPTIGERATDGAHLVVFEPA